MYNVIKWNFMLKNVFLKVQKRRFGKQQFSDDPKM